MSIEELQYDWVAGEYQPRPLAKGRSLTTHSAQQKAAAEQALLQERQLKQAALSRRLRNRGMRATLDDDWLELARAAFFVFMASGVTRFITEDFRAWWMGRGDFRAPRHHNAWGAFTFRLRRAGIIRPTGEVKPAASTKSHARKMLEWEVAR